MDLRRRLVVRLALAFAGLMVMFMLVWLSDLREDARVEQAAALRLVDLLAPAGNASGASPQAWTHGAPYRHLRVHMEPSAMSTALPETHTPDWLGLRPAQGQERRIAIGDQVLVLAADPASELREQITASLQVLAMLVVFGGLCLFMVWRAVDQALRPAREIEIGLSRLQDGAHSAKLPGFDLREFQTIAKGVEQLANSLAQAQARQADLTGALMEVQDKERRHLAAELHDEFGQSLTAISATAAFIEHHASQASKDTLAQCAREIGQESRRISDHVRQLLAQLKPYGLRETDSAEALRELIGSWQVRLPHLRLAVQIDPLPSLSEDAALALYRSLQEALTNSVRHSQASLIQVACTVEGDAVVLLVADNGVGRASALAQASGHGLAGLRERLRRVGGQLRTEDNPTGGIVLSARIPWSKERT